LDEEEIVGTLVSFYKNAKLSKAHKKVKRGVDKYLESNDLGNSVDLVEFFEVLLEPEFNLILSQECRTAVVEILKSDVEQTETTDKRAFYGRFEPPITKNRPTFESRDPRF